MELLSIWHWFWNERNSIHSHFSLCVLDEQRWLRAFVRACVVVVILIWLWSKRVLHTQTNIVYFSWIRIQSLTPARFWLQRIPYQKYHRMVTIFVTSRYVQTAYCYYVVPSYRACVQFIWWLFLLISKIACKWTKHGRIEWINYIMLDVDERYFNWIGFCVWIFLHTKLSFSSHGKMADAVWNWFSISLWASLIRNRNVTIALISNLTVWNTVIGYRIKRFSHFQHFIWFWLDGI